MQDILHSFIREEFQKLFTERSPSPQKQQNTPLESDVAPPQKLIEEVKQSSPTPSATPPPTVDIDGKIRLCNKIYKNEKMPEAMKTAIVGKILKDIGFDLPETASSSPPLPSSSKKRVQRTEDEEDEEVERPSIRRQKQQSTLRKKDSEIDDNLEDESRSISNVDVSALISSLGE